MPGGHNENTKLLGFFADNDLIARVDAARGGQARSQFMREATVEYIEKHGGQVPEHLKHPPSRAGVGGPKKKPGPQADRTSTNLTKANDAASEVGKRINRKIRSRHKPAQE